jgi:hypothetical protein
MWHPRRWQEETLHEFENLPFWSCPHSGPFLTCFLDAHFLFPSLMPLAQDGDEGLLVGCHWPENSVRIRRKFVKDKWPKWKISKLSALTLTSREMKVNLIYLVLNGIIHFQDVYWQTPWNLVIGHGLEISSRSGWTVSAVSQLFEVVDQHLSFVMQAIVENLAQVPWNSS